MNDRPLPSFTPDQAAALERARQLYVATERADGTRSGVSPIWFMHDGGALYFTTAPGTWKAKRAARGGIVHVHVGRPDGIYLRGRMTLLSDPAVAARMRPVYRRRYWLAWLGLFCPSPERVGAGKTVIIRVVPDDLRIASS